MAKQTINIGASPNDGTGTPLRTAFDYTNQNFTELYTATGPSGNNIVVPGSATITGDLTVDTSTLKVDSTNNRVGIGTATPLSALHVGSGTGLNNLGVGLSRGATTNFFEAFDGTKTLLAGTDSAQAGVKVGSLTNHPLYLVSNNTAQLEITHPGLFVFNDGAGGTRMTLNSTGLGVGMSPLTDRLTIFGSAGVNVSGGFADISFRNSPGTAIQRIRYTDGSGTLTIGSPLGTSYPVELGGNTTTRAVTIDASSNVGIGVTPSGYRLHVRAAFASTVGGAFIESGEFNQKGLLVNCTSVALAANIVEFQREGIARLTLDSAGNLILQSSATPATLATNGQLTVNATSNTNLRFSYRGSDGVTRTANLTLT